MYFWTAWYSSETSSKDTVYQRYLAALWLHFLPTGIQSLSLQIAVTARPTNQLNLKGTVWYATRNWGTDVSSHTTVQTFLAFPVVTIPFRLFQVTTTHPSHIPLYHGREGNVSGLQMPLGSFQDSSVLEDPRNRPAPKASYCSLLQFL